MSVKFSAVPSLSSHWKHQLPLWHGVRVNAIAPGVIETAMTVTTRGTPATMEKFMLRTPLGRVGQAEELVGPVIFLASDMASYITGVTLPIDGGFMAT